MSSPSDPGPDPGRRGRLTPAVSPDEPMAGSDDAGVGQDVNPARVSEQEGEGKMLETAIENVEKDRRHADGSANADAAEVVTALCDTGDNMSAEVSTQSQELEQRRRRRPYLPRELRIKIYEDFLELRKQGLSYNKIMEEVKKRYNVTISKSTLSDWENRKHSPYNGIRIPSLEFLKPSEDLAYLIGVEAGDGYVYKWSNAAPRYYGFVVGLRVSDEKFAKFFAIALAKVLKRKPPIPRLKNGRWVVEVKCKSLYELFDKPIDIEKIRKIRPFVEHCERCIAAFLRGFFDSEGSVIDGEIRVYNTNYKLLEYVIYLLNRIGIATTSDKPRLHARAGTLIRNPKTGKIYKTRRDCYYVAIRVKSLQMFYMKVGFTIERKRRRLQEYLMKRGLLRMTS